VIIVDDMISSGESMLDVAKQLKERKAGRVFVCCTFGLFTEGFEQFDEYYEKGYITNVITTNLTYLPPEAFKKPYFVLADMSKFLALIVDSMNHDVTIGAVLNPTDRIHSLLAKHQSK
ncbi:MAG: ribose-phosphate pyrophosphokinase, partial [Lachnospiraceae bacterium]